jgi:hypothetical protein
MQHYLFLLLVIFSFHANCQDTPTPEEQAAACNTAITTAETTLRNEILRHQNTLAAAPPHAVDAASNQPLSTGNPITDAMAGASRAQSELAQAQQQKMQAQSQIDNECFQQFEDISDKAHDIRQKEYDRLRQINMAEGEKMKQEADIRLACWKEASGLYQNEITALASYERRSVGSVSGATRSRRDIESLRTGFYNQCLNSQATQEAMRSSRADLDIKLRNFNLLATEFASDLEYHENTKMTRMNQHCQLRQEQVDAQYAPIRNAAIQNMAMSVLAVRMASQTAAASAEGQQQVRDSYNSLSNIISNWPRIRETCANLHTATPTGANVDAVPLDAYNVMSPIHQACRPPGNTTVRCFTSSGANSTERQRADRATATQQ